LTITINRKDVAATTLWFLVFALPALALIALIMLFMPLVLQQAAQNYMCPADTNIVECWQLTLAWQSVCFAALVAIAAFLYAGIELVLFATIREEHGPSGRLSRIAGSCLACAVALSVALGYLVL